MESSWRGKDKRSFPLLPDLRESYDLQQKNDSKRAVAARVRERRRAKGREVASGGDFPLWGLPLLRFFFFFAFFGFRLGDSARGREFGREGESVEGGGRRG